MNRQADAALTRVTGNLQPYSLLQAFFIRSHANERVLEPSSPAKGKVTIVFRMMKEGTDADAMAAYFKWSFQLKCHNYFRYLQISKTLLIL